ncbi:AAA family ATPase [Roseicyclus persicicus]|uniref:Pilus assembly protein CpaE n=1 Tax=Roseicyclus persicicus TaxID=2650661 RepID=A0A7X6H234_9RHOB|nr:hypothetical protein [Roseibacterium persicicum]NKX45934.1 hypothetical protein [Roseibacterium persicicum]
MAQPTLSRSRPDPIVAFVCTEEGADLARAVAANIGAPAPTLHGGGVSAAARLGPEVGTGPVLAEIGNLPLDLACESVSAIGRAGARLVAFGRQSDLGTYRAIRKAGATDYFAFPVEVADLVQSLAQTVANAPTPALDPTLRIGVTGSNGGVGASLLAQNLAALSAASARTRRQTALIDGDLRFGSIGCDLNRDHSRGLIEALSAPDRIDETFLRNSMDHLGDRLALYSSAAAGLADVRALQGRIGRVVHGVAQHFETTVVDLPRELLFDQPGLLAALRSLVLVVPAGYSGVQAAARALAHLRDAAPHLQVVPVLSELRADAALSRADLSAALEIDIRHVLPRSDAALMRAHRRGQPAVTQAPNGAYARAVLRLWAELSAPADAGARRGKPGARFLRGLLGRSAG